MYFSKKNMYFLKKNMSPFERLFGFIQHLVLRFKHIFDYFFKDFFFGVYFVEDVDCGGETLGF